MNIYWRHFRTILRHKWHVFKFCVKMGIPWQGIIHDLSKFHPAEFFASARYFLGTRSPLEAEKQQKGYSYAWNRHKGRNKHHWQWYVDNDDVDNRGEIRWVAAPIPAKYIKEMYCDMMGASRVYGGGSAIDYYNKHGNEWLMDKESRQYLEKLLYSNGLYR